MKLHLLLLPRIKQLYLLHPIPHFTITILQTISPSVSLNTLLDTHSKPTKNYQNFSLKNHLLMTPLLLIHLQRMNPNPLFPILPLHHFQRIIHRSCQQTLKIQPILHPTQIPSTEIPKPLPHNTHSMTPFEAFPNMPLNFHPGFIMMPK